MRGFRSPLLQALPRDRREGATERSARRLFLSAMLVLALVTLFILVRRRALPVSGFYWVYWFHDQIYLTLKGALFTRYFPWSLAWGGVLASLILIGWWTFIIGKSPLQDPHAFLVRWAARNTSLHSPLIGLAELFKRMGLNMAMMRSAVAVERQIQLDRLFQLRDQTQQRRLLHRYLRQSDFWLGLTLVHRDKEDVRREALGMGLSTLLWVEPILAEESKRPERQVLNVMNARLVRLLPLPRNAKALNEAMAWPGSLQESSIALDTLLLLSGYVPEGEARLGAVLEEVHSEKVNFTDLVRLRLAQATEDRLKLYEGMRQILETQPYGRNQVDPFDRNWPAADPETDGLWREQALQALLLACHSSRLLEEPDLLARYLDAIDALAIAAEAASPSPDSPLADIRHHGLVITQALPTTEIFRYAAQIAAFYEAQALELRKPLQWPDGIPGTGNYRDVWELSTAMRQAAGQEGDRVDLMEVAP